MLPSIVHIGWLRRSTTNEGFLAMVSNNFSYQARTFGCGNLIPESVTQSDIPSKRKTNHDTITADGRYYSIPGSGDLCETMG
jgi:hypothetical protein